jgi:hypothetical protein
MIKLLISLVILSVMTVEARNNNAGYLDTAKVRVRSDSLYYSRSFDLSGSEDIRAILMVNDTASAGYAGDSINIQWGYQTFSLVMNSLGKADTAFDQRICLDTITTAVLGTLPAAIGVSVYDGSITRSTKIADTLSVTGYATQSKWFLPEWDVGIRFWFKGLTGNKTTSSVLGILGVQRRLYINVRNK